MGMSEDQVILKKKRKESLTHTRSTGFVDPSIGPLIERNFCGGWCNPKLVSWPAEIINQKHYILRELAEVGATFKDL